MKAAYDEIVAAALKRNHDPRRIVAAMLAAEIAEKQWLRRPLLVSDQLTDGHRFRTMTIVDDCTRQNIALAANTSLSCCGWQPYWIGGTRHAEDDRQRQRNRAEGQRSYFSRPGKPTDDVFIESLNGKFRAECQTPTGS
ncbi:hypothetical protein EYW49_18025 [Siculibacillus lacustris]|uniref:Transposase n=1 Tax=Siculibacillus lacustris TaxID=1549641 RepID=A0A4V2KSV6_9HYPH|nr:hypothetical protein EYW49_18025 [Siculibacillus lacustris]